MSEQSPDVDLFRVLAELRQTGGDADFLGAITDAGGNADQLTEDIPRVDQAIDDLLAGRPNALVDQLRNEILALEEDS